MKNIFGKWQFWAIIILVLFSIIYIIINFNDTFNINKTLNNYRKQSIKTLNQYKSGNLARKETSEKLEIIAEKLEKEYNENNDSTSLFTLEVKLTYISYKLLNEELSDTDIDNYIQEINKIN